MQNLIRASEELFRCGPDECFATFDALWQHCQEAKTRSVERWHPPTELRVEPYAGQLRLLGGEEATYRLNDWSFTQLCSLAGVSKDTVNRLSAPTASQVFAETLPAGGKPLQLLGNKARRHSGTKRSGPRNPDPALRAPDPALHSGDNRTARRYDCVLGGSGMHDGPP